MILYVGNLPFNTTNQELTGLFKTSGPVKYAKIIQDWLTGRSRGFAFIEMEEHEDAQKAIQQLNGKEVYGRTIKVVEARTQNRGRDTRNDLRGGYARSENEPRGEFGGRSW